ncbi:helix-turn-helix domain-containing protein [Defluviimonas aestuarii]|uniref:helix-turn-helix domain-containing protein n=1 Tax=Albidovulum aestuarii TaxID=1130726 RepID=UPI002499C0CF|nr:helix-turn-helix domain-containing protein [Defluviimonas aestuarii]MDI3336859.1 helix-turn-helix domain-containing protein [Defluviimonas aestuarii]
MSNLATNWVNTLTLPPAQMGVLRVLADMHNGKTGACWPSISKICARSGYSKSTVRRAINALEAAGLLVVHHRLRRGTGWQMSCYYELRIV